MPNPLATDIVITQAAEHCGLTVYRRDRITVDRGHLPAAFWTEQPDYRKIAAALDRGDEVPGARRLVGVEWVLKEEIDSAVGSQAGPGERG